MYMKFLQCKSFAIAYTKRFKKGVFLLEYAIEIHDLVKYYGKSRGVSNISFTVSKGDFFGFIGPNGAGKSTTIRSMLGLIHMNSGSIRILGMDAVKDHIKILQKVGYMPSETMFYPNLKVSQIIHMTEEAYQMNCRERANELCDRLQVNTKKRIEELSLGNRKKVNIVCAMQHNPELYIFDEPTSGLDPLMQKEFFQLLGEVNKQGATIFFSSHVLNEVQTYCTNAAIIKEGKLVAVDKVSNLTKTSARRVTLRGFKTVPIIDGISNSYTDDNMVSFLYNGNSKELLKQLIALDIYDVLIEEPSLEEIVLHYYGEDAL